MGSDLPPPDPGQIPGILIWIAGINATTQANYCAATTWLLYDLLLSFEDEVQLIWRSQNRAPKFMYFCSRYLGLITLICLSRTDLLPMYCPSRFIFQAVTYSILSLCIQLGLMVRVYALWGQSRRVGWALVIGFLMSETGMICMVSFGLPTILGGLVPVPPGMLLKGCIITAFPKFYSLCWLPTLCFETFLFAMNTISCLSYRPLHYTPTVVRVLRDGTVYYASVCIILSLTTIGSYFPLTGLTEFADPWLPAVFSFSGARLLLSIRQLAAERQQRLALSTISTSISGSNSTSQKPTTTTSEDIELQRLERTPLSSLQHHHHQQSAATTPRTTRNSIAVVPLHIPGRQDPHYVAEADVEPALPTTPGAFSKRHHHESSYSYRYPPSVPRRSQDIERAYADALGPRDQRQHPTRDPLSFEAARRSSGGLFERLKQAWSLDWVRDWEYRY